MGRQIWDGAALYEPGETWPKDKPIVDAIAPDGSFDELTSSLSLLASRRACLVAALSRSKQR